MSHDHSRRDSCGVRISSRKFHSKVDKVARGVTAVVVGSGALLGDFFNSGNLSDFILELRRSFHPDTSREEKMPLRVKGLSGGVLQASRAYGEIEP
jgi:hypothetical protein